MKTSNIIVTGVGGQGSILAAHILGKAAIRQMEKSHSKVQVRIGETYGAAMRGGKVVSHVRIGQVYAPLIAENAADIIIGLEPLETLRVAAIYLAPQGDVVVNTFPYIPADVKMGRVEYPEISTIVDHLKQLGRSVIAFDATSIAQEMGTPAVMNIILLGAASALVALPVDEETLLETIRVEVPPATIGLNLASFQRGREFAMSCRQDKEN